MRRRSARSDANQNDRRSSEASDAVRRPSRAAELLHHVAAVLAVRLGDGFRRSHPDSNPVAEDHPRRGRRLETTSRHPRSVEHEIHERFGALSIQGKAAEESTQVNGSDEGLHDQVDRHIRPNLTS